MTTLSELSLDVATLLHGYRTRTFTPTDVIGEVYRRIAARGDDKVWLHLTPREVALQRAAALERGDRQLALYGMPYGVKDNIDVADMPTTAGCAALRYVPTRSAALVERLDAAGAILLGKQNMDQFATGLVGIRCPGGHCVNAIEPSYIPGGSSSGSAVAVAAGLASFSIGSDTGGSGRVPAAYNDIVGLKATPGLLSTRGFLYCNRSFDVPSIFALTVADAHAVLEAVRGNDPDDPSTAEGSPSSTLTGRDPLARAFRFAIPREDQLELYGDTASQLRFAWALAQLRALGGEPVEIDFAPFLEAGRLVFQSALVAERWLTYGATIERAPETVHPAVLAAISNAKQYGASDAFAALYRLSELKIQVLRALEPVACLVTPTVGTLYTIEEVEADPLVLNTRMGYYTYFANPLRLCAISVPTGLREDGLPFGLSLAAPAFQEATLARIAAALEARSGRRSQILDRVAQAARRRGPVAAHPVR